MKLYAKVTSDTGGMRSQTLTRGGHHRLEVAVLHEQISGRSKPVVTVEANDQGVFVFGRCGEALFHYSVNEAETSARARAAR